MSEKVLLLGSIPEIHIDPDVAIVGSSQTLMGREYGVQIDQHTEVIRFNFAKLKGYEKDVGVRETIRHWALTKKRLDMLYPDKEKMRRDIIETTNAPILLSFLHMAEIRENGEFYGRTDNVYGLHNNVDKLVEQHGFKFSKSPRTGMVMLAALICSGIKPHVYGFSTGTKGTEHRAHYFKNARVPTVGYHNVLEEEAIIRQLSDMGLIVFHECNVGRKSNVENRRKLMGELVKEGDVVAELGVDWGSFSNFILGKTPCGKLYSIDRWAGDRGHDDKQESDCRGLLGKYGDRSEVIKATFDEALPLIEDESLDVIYIDGYAHTGQENGKTLRDWWRKVKPGGFMSGHDYCGKWPKTKAAVDAFAKSKGLRAKSTNDAKEFESWWMQKPEKDD